jgi:DNA-binding transcriptional LysR family regulator
MRSQTETLRGYRRLMGSMTALIEFEAAARLGSFTMAANEIGVTQAAVSKQIRELEEDLGVRLFHRLHRSIELTAEGKALYLAVSASLQRISGVYDQLKSGGEDQELTLAATAAFSHFRLSPRLGALNEALPNVTLRLLTQMVSSDMRHKDVDVAIRYGDGRWPDGTPHLLFDEEVFPVCAPSWLESHRPPDNVVELAALALIDSEATSEGWMRWEDWFQAVGAAPSKLHFNFRCSLYPDVIQAARKGQGIALGWARLIDELVMSGELVRLTDVSVKVPHSYFAVVPHGREITPAIRSLIDWLRDDGARSVAKDVT